MESMLSTLAFALLIGGQFLGAIVLISKRDAIYEQVRRPKEGKHLPSDKIQGANGGQQLPAKAVL